METKPFTLRVVMSVEIMTNVDFKSSSDTSTKRSEGFEVPFVGRFELALNVDVACFCNKYGAVAQLVRASDS